LKKTDLFPLHAIRSEADHSASMALAAPYFDHEPDPESDAGAHFEALLGLIVTYEAKRYPNAFTTSAVNPSPR